MAGSEGSTSVPYRTLGSTGERVSAIGIGGQLALTIGQPIAPGRGMEATESVAALRGLRAFG